MTVRAAERLADRRLAVAIGLLFASFVLWALASPLMSVPDEPWHVVKAAAVWQGELRGTRIDYPPEQPGDPPLSSFRVRVGASYASVVDVAGCYFFQPDVTADCSPPLAPGSKIVDSQTLAGTYPPLYYLLVGWPTRLMSASSGIYVMRIVSAALCAALFGAGVWANRRRWTTGWCIALLTVAATPLVHFFSGAVNPNGFEIAAAFATWCAGVAIVRDWDTAPSPPRGRVALYLVAAAALAFTRTLSPLYLAVIVVMVLAFGGLDRLRKLARDRRAWALAATTGAIVVFSFLEVVILGHLDTVPGGAGSLASVEKFIASSDDWFSQMVGVFGWLDVGPVVLAVWGWIAMYGLLGGATVALARPRQFVVATLVAIGTAAANVVLAARSGIAWQGRYVLPLGVGVAVLCIAALTDTARGPEGLPATFTRRVPLLLAVMASIGQIASQFSALRRYAVGSDHTLNFLSDPRWTPPGGVWWITIAVVAVWCAWCVVAAGPLLARRPPRAEPVHDAA